MNPKNLYVVTYKSKHIGHQSIKGCSAFTFLKPQHALLVSQYVNNQYFHVKKMHPTLYVIRQTNHRYQPQRETIIQSVEPENLVLEMAINMLNLELIDDVSDNGRELVLCSNYDLGISLEINNDIMKKRLQALYDQQNFMEQLE